MLPRVYFATTARSFTLKTAISNHGRIICIKDAAIIFSSSKYIALIGHHVNLKWKSSKTNENSLSEIKENRTSQLTVGQKVKEATKDASYLGVIIAGIGVTGAIFYAILSELFSKQSPSSVYTEAFKLCCNDVNLANILGEPIKGYGELSARGRRHHVSHFEYEKNGVKYMRMKFYVEGIRKKGTVHLEVKQNLKGKYEHRYLFVDIDGYPPRTYILQDNRHEDNLGSIDFKM